MSVHKRANGTWETKWRAGGRLRSRTFERKRDAAAFDIEVKRAKRLGEVGLLDGGAQTLEELAEEWWRTYAEPNLERKTREIYAGVWDRHVLPRIGGLRLRDVTPEVIEGLQADLRRSGVGQATVTKCRTVLSSMLRSAVVWQRIPYNAVSATKAPRQPKPRRASAVAPHTVERMRARLLADGRLGDATLVSVLAYAGLRPSEALALRWDHVGDNTLHVEQAVSDGVVGRTKTGGRRSVRLFGPLGQDLREWRLASGRPSDSAFVFPRGDGAPWRETDYRNWRKRVYRPAAEVAGEPTLRPYDLRHSYASLRIYERALEIEVADEMGNSPTMVRERYGHILDEFANGQLVNAEQAIKEARVFAESSQDTSAAAVR